MRCILRNRNIVYQYLGLVTLFLLAHYNLVIAQNDYTVGNGYMDNHDAVVYAPFSWEGLDVNSWGETTFCNHLGYTASSGQRYTVWEYLEEYPPSEYGSSLDVPTFLDIIQDDYYLGVLYIATHGNVLQFVVETYEYSTYGRDNREWWYDYYVDTDGYGGDEGQFQPYELAAGEVAGVAYTISVRSPFIRNYGHLNQALIYLGACRGYNFSYAFTSCGARVALGYSDSLSRVELRNDVSQFFGRLDGQEGQVYREVSSAISGMDKLVVSGSQNTTLAPSVMSTVVPDPLKIGDTIIINLDTKCYDFVSPNLWCLWGAVDSPVWQDSSTILAEYTRGPPAGYYEERITLAWWSVKSSMNPAYLDGNTDPYVQVNAHGQSEDDYELIVPALPWFCGTPFGDLDCSGGLNPLDVICIVNFVYQTQDWRCYPDGWNCPCYPDGWNCPYDLGDVDCDYMVNAVDVVFYVNYVYKNYQPFPCSDPCQ